MKNQLAATFLCVFVLPTAFSQTLTANSGINFGQFVVLSTCVNCTITIPTSGAPIASVGVILKGGTTGPATFTLDMPAAGNAQQAKYTVTDPVTTTPAIPMTPLTPGMTLGNFSVLAPLATSLGKNLGYAATVTIGATLTIPNSTSFGNFSANFNVVTNP